MHRTRILIADDHPVFRQGLVSVFRNDSAITVIGEAIDGHQALKLTEELQALANVMQPFQIVFADPRIVEVLLADFRAHREHWNQLESALAVLRGKVEALTGEAND